MAAQTKAEAMRARYARRKALGLCGQAGCSRRAAEGKVYCPKHLEYYRVQAAEGRMKKGAREGVTGRPPVNVEDLIEQAKRERNRASSLASYYRRKSNASSSHP